MTDKKKEYIINSFRKSTESTIRAITKKVNINIKFDDNTDKNNKLISLPKINNELSPKDISFIRGLSDSASLINKFHNFSLHTKMRPINNQKAMIFDELEFLRCESLGAKKLPGIRQNINFVEQQYLKKLGKEETLSKPLTFKFIFKKNIFNQKISEKFLQTSDPIKNALLKIIKDRKLSLEDFIYNQKEFSEISLEIIDLTFKTDNISSEENPVDENSDDNDNDDINNDKKSEEEDHDEVKKSSTETPQIFETEQDLKLDENLSDSDDNDENNKEVKSRFDTQTNKKDHNYKIFTKKYDKICYAEDLCDEEEVFKLRDQLNKQTSKLDSTITILANKLQRKLLSKQTRWWEFDLEEGILDSGKLSRVIISPSNSLSYKKEAETSFKDTVVTLLIDNSGSMRGRPITIAAITADIISRTLERCGVKVEVLGFTTKSWKGGRTRDKWLKEKQKATIKLSPSLSLQI